YTAGSGVSWATLIVSTLTRCRYWSSTWPSAWPRSRLAPASSRISVIESTAARLTAALRQKFCQALSSANSRFRQTHMVFPRPVVPDHPAPLDRHHAAAHQVHDVAVVRGH